MANSKLIVIEGLDGVGKNTQSNLLTKYLSEKYGDTVLYSFPRNHSPTGKRVADYLNGGLDELTLLEKAKLNTSKTSFGKFNFILIRKLSNSPKN